MATDKQIAANRANAKRSTGPKTTMGRLKSSRNAFRHGLSCAMPLDPEMLARVDAIAHDLMCNVDDEEKLGAATALALAHLELARIRTVRAQLMATLNLEGGDPQDLARLVALDRYERLAHTKRRRASEEL